MTQAGIGVLFDSVRYKDALTQAGIRILFKSVRYKDAVKINQVAGCCFTHQATGCGSIFDSSIFVFLLLQRVQQLQALTLCPHKRKRDSLLNMSFVLLARRVQGNR